MMIVTHTAWARTRETVDDERIVLLNITQKIITTCVDTNMCIGQGSTDTVVQQTRT